MPHLVQDLQFRLGLEWGEPFEVLQQAMHFEEAVEYVVVVQNAFSTWRPVLHERNLYSREHLRNRLKHLCRWCWVQLVANVTVHLNPILDVVCLLQTAQRHAYVRLRDGEMVPQFPLDPLNYGVRDSPN